MASLNLNPPQYTGHLSGSPSESPLASPSAPSGASAPFSGQDVLLERSEIDKSLKSLETLLGVLYDYAQVWSSLVSLDKKLVKALREAGSLKRQEGVEWPGSIFTTSSQVFESITECDAKFAKILEREYESSNQELKKWLKKLKKEDKSLDDYCSTANTKLKSAQSNLAKSQKKSFSPLASSSVANSSTAALQNLEYQTLLSQLSQSLAQAKHQHTLFISTRHISSLYAISGSVGKISDAQWMKTADALRRIAGVAGTLGEARAYVEGGWRGGRVGELPLSLPVDERGIPMNVPLEAPMRDDEGERTLKARDAATTTTTGGELPISTPLRTPEVEKNLPSSKPLTSQETGGRITAQDTGTKSLRPQETGGRTSNADMLETIRRELLGGEEDKPTTSKDSTPVKKEDPRPSPIATKESEKSKSTASKPTEEKAKSAETSKGKVPEPSNVTNSTGTNFSSSTSTSAKDTLTSVSSKSSPVATKAPGVEASKAGEDKKVENEKTRGPPRIPTPPTVKDKDEEEDVLFAPRHALARTPLNVSLPSTKEEQEAPFAPKHALARTPAPAPLNTMASPNSNAVSGSMSPRLANPSSPPTIFSSRKDGLPINTPLVKQDPPPELHRPLATRPAPSQPQGSSYFPREALDRQDTGGRPFQPQHRSNTSLPTTGPAMPAASIPGYAGQMPGAFPSHTSPPVGSPPQPREAYGKPVNRTLSIDSTASNGSGMVAQLRERWNAASPPPQSPNNGSTNQAWRDAYARDSDRYPRPGFDANQNGGRGPFAGERGGYGGGGSRVQDMASRFTPIEGPTHLSHNSTFQMGGDRYPNSTARDAGAWSPSPIGHVQDVGRDREMTRDRDSGRDMVGDLPLRVPHKRSSVDEFGSSFSGANTGRRGAETMPHLGVDRRAPLTPSLSRNEDTQPNYDLKRGEFELQHRQMELEKREMELEIQRERLKLEREKEQLMRERQQTLRAPGTPGEYARSGTPGGEFGRNNSGEFGRGEFARSPPGGDYSRSGGYSSGTDFGSMRDRDGYSSDRAPAGGYRRNTIDEDRTYGGYNSNREAQRDEGYGHPYEAPGFNGYSSSPYQPRDTLGTPRMNPAYAREGMDMSTGLGVMGLGLPPSRGMGASTPSLAPGTPSLAPPSVMPTTPSMGMKSRESFGVISTEEGSTASHATKEKASNEGGAGGAKARKSADSAGAAKDKGGTWLGKGLKRFSMA